MTAHVIDERQQKVDSRGAEPSDILVAHASQPQPRAITTIAWSDVVLAQPVVIRKRDRRALPRGRSFDFTPEMLDALRAQPQAPDDDYDGSYSLLEDE